MKKYMLTTVCGLCLAFGAAAAAEAQVYVHVGPPPPRREFRPAPRPGYEWQPGYHRWDGHAYVWVPGAYAAPPRRGVHWVPGHWDRRHGGYFWVDGHWR
ncbi:MAG: hypothetical protein PW792_00785 [Acidobacteriaceae bacterium]|nr:hypothetical protein [Acidobacteriaceae bacterium]